MRVLQINVCVLSLTPLIEKKQRGQQQQETIRLSSPAEVLAFSKCHSSCFRIHKFTLGGAVIRLTSDASLYEEIGLLD